MSERVDEEPCPPTLRTGEESLKSQVMGQRCRDRHKCFLREYGAACPETCLFYKEAKEFTNE